MRKICRPPIGALTSFTQVSLLLSLFSGQLYAQQQPAGVVTALQGKAQLTRPAAPGAVALRFKDGVLVRDVIETQEKSLVRVLFGGKSTVTLRELSRLEVREEFLPTGGTRYTHELSSGGVLVNVARQLMRPDDEVIIRTPNAVTAVRGTVVFFQYFQALGQTVMTVISGLVNALGQQIGPNTQAIITGTDIKISTISQQQANQILNQSQIGGKPSSENSQTQTAMATQVADVLVTLTGGGGPPPQPPPPPPPPLSGCEADPTICEPSFSFPLTPPATVVVANDSLDTGTSSLFNLPSGQTAVQSEPLLIGTNAVINIGGNGFDNSGNFTSTSPDPLFQFTDSTVTVGTDLVKMIGGSLTTAGGLLKISGGSLTLGATSLLNLSGGASVTVGGTILDLTNISLDLGLDPVVRNTGGSTLANTAGPVIKITNGSLTADLLGLGDGTETYNFTGSLLDLTNATVTLRTLGEDVPGCNCDNANFTLAANEPLLKLTSSTLTLTDNTDHDIGPTSSLDPQTGVVLSATNSTINVAGPLFGFHDVNLIDTIPQIQLINTKVTQTGSESLIRVQGLVAIGGSLFQATGESFITIDASLLNAGFAATLNVGTDPAVSGNLVDINSGGQLIMNSSNPVVLFGGGTHTVGTADVTAFNTPNRIFNLQGVSTDNVTGLGTDQVVKGTSLPFIDSFTLATANNPIGVLLKATNGATIEVKAGAGDLVSNGVFPGNAVRLDKMLYESVAGIIELTGTGTTDLTATKLTTAGDTIDIFQSKVVSLGPVIALDNGLIHVTNGALITLTNGSNMNVTGDLLSLINGSKINVVNGPLILVTGSAPIGTTPAVSTLNVSGALVNFGGSGGNQIIVNNAIAPTATLSGIPVNTATGGTISIGPNPIKNTGLGSITINGTPTGAGPFTGSLIQTTNGGTVNIVAPAPPP